MLVEKKCCGYAITKNIGEMYLFENIHELHFVYNISELEHNLKDIREKKIKLDRLCNQSDFIANCQFFVNYINDEIDSIEDDMIKLRSRKGRKRRAFNKPLWNSLDTLLKDEHPTKEDEFKNSMQILKGLIRAITEMTDELNESGTRIDQRIIKLKKACMLQTLLSVTNSLISNHKVKMNRINGIFEKDIKEHFFIIIKESEFINEIRGLQIQLNEELTLPQIPILDLIKTAKIQTFIHESYIYITVRIPLVKKIKYTMGKFVPIPISKGNKTIIIDAEIAYFVKTESEIYIISPENLMKCMNVQNITICNSFIEYTFVTPEKCMYSYMKNDSIEFCTIIEIEHKNQIVEISNTSIFIYLTNPIEVRIIHEGKEKLIDLTKSDIINFPRGSEITLYTNKSRRTSTTRKMLNMTTLSYNFRIDDFDEDKWRIRSLSLSKFETYLLELENEVEKTINRNDQNYIFSFIYDTISDELFINILLWSLKWIVIPCVLFIMLKKLFRKVTKNLF